MRSADLFDCFHRHLNNIDIAVETDEAFIAKVLEDFILNLNHLGFTMGSHAEEIYVELQEEVQVMLKTKIYGFFSLDLYRDHLRKASEPAA